MPRAGDEVRRSSLLREIRLRRKGHALEAQSYGGAGRGCAQVSGLPRGPIPYGLVRLGICGRFHEGQDSIIFP